MISLVIGADVVLMAAMFVTAVAVVAYLVGYKNGQDSVDLIGTLAYMRQAGATPVAEVKPIEFDDAIVKTSIRAGEFSPLMKKRSEWIGPADGEWN